MQAAQQWQTWDESSSSLLAPSISLLVCSCRETSSHRQYHQNRGREMAAQKATLLKLDLRCSRRHRPTKEVSLHLSAAAQATQRSVLSNHRQARGQPHCVHEASPALPPRNISACTKPQRQGNQESLNKREEKIISMTIFKCDPSCISEGCRKIKISRFLPVCVHPPTAEGRAGKQKLMGSSKGLSQSHLLFYCGSLSLSTFGSGTLLGG